MSLKSLQPKFLWHSIQGIRPYFEKRLPTTFRETVKLRAFGFLKVPLLFLISPKILNISDQRIEVKVPLNRRTRNHVKSMYFGVLAAGADCACGALAYYLIDKMASGRVQLLFKDFKADFLKRAEGDVVFVCTQGDLIRQTILKAMETGERQNVPIEVTALVPSLSETDSVAQFVLTLSLKYR